MIIAIDGPAASGKGTIGRLVADHFSLHYLDTGLLYRAVGAELLAQSLPITDEAKAASLAQQLPLDHLDETALGKPEIGEAASRVAAMPAVRAALIERQHAFAAQPPGAVLVGRDIGTVVCPDAEVKIFLTATPEIRAARRADQLGLEDASARADILEGIKARDKRDTERPVAPLRQAADARLLDTTELDIEAAFRAAVEIVNQATGTTT
jgi:cytidylate kinase